MFSRPPSPKSVADDEIIGELPVQVFVQVIMLVPVPVTDNEDMMSMWSSFMFGSYGAMFTSLACEGLNNYLFGWEDKDIQPFILPMFKASFSLSTAILIKSFPSDKMFINQVTFTCLFNIGYSLWEEGLNRNIPHIMINTALLLLPDFVKNNPMLTGFSSNILDHSCAKFLYNVNEYIMSSLSYIEEELEVQLNKILFNDLEIYE